MRGRTLPFEAIEVKAEAVHTERVPVEFEHTRVQTLRGVSALPPHMEVGGTLSLACSVGQLEY